MIIDAMDLLHTGRFSGFCIVSSDSDFTRLAARIREHGVAVYGFGERKTPRSFITCLRKICLFRRARRARKAEALGRAGRGKAKTTKNAGTKRCIAMLRTAMPGRRRRRWPSQPRKESARILPKQAPDFDSRTLRLSPSAANSSMRPELLTSSEPAMGRRSVWSA